MAGELWNQQWEIGLESTSGSAVASTRIMYFGPDSALTREREPRMHKYMSGTRNTQRAFSLGPQQVGGTLDMPLSASEIIEFLLMTVDGSVTPTGAGSAKLWTFVPGTAVKSATIRWHDGARPWTAAGIVGSKLKISGSVKDATTVTLDVMGYSLTQAALTGSLTARIPDIIEGWETKLYMDAFGGTAGSTAVTDSLINWEVEIDNQLTRKYIANNVLTVASLPLGELAVKAKFTLEASAARALTEYNNWDAATKRLIRLEFGQNEVISGGDKKFVTVDLPGAWEAVDLGQTDEGTRAYELSLDYVYDTTNSFGVQIRAQNARSTAW